MLLFICRKFQKMEKHDIFINIYTKQYSQNKHFFTEVFQKFLLLLIPQSLVDSFILFYLLYQCNNQTVI